MAKLYEFEMAFTVRAVNKDDAERLAIDVKKILQQRTDIVTEDSVYISAGPEIADNQDEDDEYHDEGDGDES